jgi:hypothetical protein
MARAKPSMNAGVYPATAIPMTLSQGRSTEEILADAKAKSESYKYVGTGMDRFIGKTTPSQARTTEDILAENKLVSKGEVYTGTGMENAMVKAGYGNLKANFVTQGPLNIQTMPAAQARSTEEILADAKAKSERDGYKGTGMDRFIAKALENQPRTTEDILAEDKKMSKRDLYIGSGMERAMARASCANDSKSLSAPCTAEDILAVQFPFASPGWTTEEILTATNAKSRCGQYVGTGMERYMARVVTSN